MRVIAITNQKGGTGKTTTAVSIAGALVERGHRVLLVDLDSQANASHWLGVGENGQGLLSVLAGELPLRDLVHDTELADLALVPGGDSLALAERQLAGEVGAETLLRDAIRSLPRKRWDYLLIDCPPALDVRAVAALTAAREVLVPIEARVMPLEGLVSLTQTVDTVRRRLNRRLAITGLLAVRVDRRTLLSLEIVEELRKRFPELMFAAVVRENVRLAEAPSHRRPITAYAPSSAGAEDYRAAAAELEARAP